VDLESLWTRLDECLLPVLRDYRRWLPTLDVTEKPDRTLLSEADIAVQRLIVESIMDAFPGSGFVAEEDDEQLPRTGATMWIIDPIDGTSEFVNPRAREYCSVVCKLDEGRPVAAYVLAPELGTESSSISIHWSDAVTVNGQPASALPDRDTPTRASVTRSKESPPRPYEDGLERIGCGMKIRTTSQTLDMVRSAIDLTALTGAPDNQFDLFYRQDQKVWDGAAGIGLATAMGRINRNKHDDDPIPMASEFLRQREPTFEATVSGAPSCVRWFLNTLRTE
jgi:3'(2'), 5'-bisphosphate nucleotidase